MKTTLLVLVVLLTTGCSYMSAGDTYVDYRIGYHAHRNNFPGGKDLSQLTVGHEMKHFYIEYQHQSNISDGSPFNNLPETTEETVFIGKRWVVRRGK